MVRVPVILVTCALLGVSSQGAQEKQGGQEKPDPVRISVQSLFHEVDGAEAAVLIRSLELLVHDVTGLRTKVIQGGDAFALAQDLKEGKVHFGLFQGYEFAWVHKDDAKLKPLMLAAYYNVTLRASLVVQ